MGCLGNDPTLEDGPAPAPGLAPEIVDPLLYTAGEDGPPMVLQDLTFVGAMTALAQQYPGRVAVLLIDMDSEYRGDSYDGRAVVDHQVEALQHAVTLGLPIFDIWIDNLFREHYPDAPDSYLDRPSNNTQVLQDAMAGGEVIGYAKPNHNSFQGLSFPHEGPLGAALEERGIQAAIVMGHHGGQCVRATIFGTDWITYNPNFPPDERTVPLPGLRARGISVLTSRTLLVTGGAPLNNYLGYALPDADPGGGGDDLATISPALGQKGQAKNKKKKKTSNKGHKR